MRIVSGTFRSRPILAPKTGEVRPTSDKVRQAVFNVLEHATWAPALEGAIVLDAFCGTGALGLEALSRGASYVAFMDQNTHNVEANIKIFNIDKMCNMFRADILNPPPARQACDFIFLDPPYKKNLIAPALAALRDKGWMHDNTIVIAESEKEWRLPHALQEKIYGVAKVTFLKASNLS